MKIFIFIILSIVLASSYANQNKCMALIISGGGDLGAYEAGVISALVKNLPAEDTQWDIFSGISVGAITAAGMNSYPSDEYVKATEWAKTLWMSMTFSNIVGMWPNGGIISGLIFQSGLFDNSPMRQFIKKNLDYSRGPQKKLIIGATDVQTGELIRLNETSFATVDDMIEGILASSAVPVIFPMSELFGYQFFDGGLAMMYDIVGAIDRCHRDGFEDSQIILDLILVESNSNDTMPVWGPGEKKYTMQVYNRQLRLQEKNMFLVEYQEARDLYPQVNFRYYVEPQVPLPWSDFPLTFVHSDLVKMIDIGYQDGLKAIKKGPGVMAQEAYEHAEEMQLQRMNRRLFNNQEIM